MKISCKASEQKRNGPTGLRPAGPERNKSASKNKLSPKQQISSDEQLQQNEGEK